MSTNCEKFAQENFITKTEFQTERIGLHGICIANKKGAMKDFSCFPEELWRQPLFQSAAEFMAPTTPLLVARLDARMRKLRNMPSTADESSLRIMSGVEELAGHVEKWISRNGGAESRFMNLLTRLETLRRAAERNLAIERFRSALLELSAGLGEEAQALLSGMKLDNVSEIVSVIDFLKLLTLERAALGNDKWRRSYLRKAYQIVDKALAYNSTTDAPRYVPVLSWIRNVLGGRKSQNSSYVDVGCAALEQAPGLVLAGRLLHEGGLCAPCLHGTDVRVPPLSARLELLRSQCIAIYACDPVKRPLPKRYDVILLANVHRHLTVELQKLLFRNLFESLSEHGLLFVTWRFNAENSPGVCLERKGGAFALAGQTNLI